MAHEEARYVRGVLPYPSSPTLTLYSPSATEYMKVTPSEHTLDTKVAPVDVTDDLCWASIITHRIADTTNTIAADDTDSLVESKALADELLEDTVAHIKDTDYHAVAGEAWYAGHIEDDDVNLSTAAPMSNPATGYTLADELDDDVTAHLASTTFHAVATVASDFGGTPATVEALTTKVNLLRTAMIAHFGDDEAHSVADVENLRLATATTPGTDQTSTQTLINLLQGYWNSHCAVGDATAADLAAVIVAANACKAGLIAHFRDTVTHGGLADETNAETLEAIADCSDAATSYTLLNGLKAAYSTGHCAVTDGDLHVNVAAALMPMDWPSRGSFWCKTNSSGNAFVTAEFKDY